MTHVPWIDPARIDFPSVNNALKEPNGLLAIGGDLSSDRLVQAYRKGIFPWYEDGQPILWWSPDPRSVIFPGEVKISRSLRKTLAKNNFSVDYDNAFQEVIRSCAATKPGREQTWITRSVCSC